MQLLIDFAVADIAEGPDEQARVGGAVHGGGVPDGRHRHRHAVQLPAQHQGILILIILIT